METSKHYHRCIWRTLFIWEQLGGPCHYAGSSASLAFRKDIQAPKLRKNKRPKKPLSWNKQAPFCSAELAPGAVPKAW